jgi:hypothetical protein
MSWLSSLYFALFLPIVLGTPAKPECIHHAGTSVCGHHCVKGEGLARCAQTPEGVCTVTSGVVACWDPPGFLTSALEEELPKARCVTSNGQVACGFHCLISHGKPQCAQTPFGACRANAGTVLCWDPPAHVIADRKGQTPRASCISAFDKVACGYHCEANEGELRCAQTPDGVCRREGGLMCWDPPPKTVMAFASGSTVACLDANGGRSCGYRCLATNKQTRCGSSENDYCFVTPQDRIACTAGY